jgi:predicted nucleotidyltransferase
MTTKETILDFIRANKKVLQEQYSVEKIALFGSFGRNEQTSKSDIDLLVTLKKNTPDIYEIKQGLRDFFGMHFHCNVDIASEKYLKPFIREEILREAQYA